MLGSGSANVAVELDSIFASVKHRESGFNCAWQDEFPWLLFTAEVKIRVQLKFYANIVLFKIFILYHHV